MKVSNLKLTPLNEKGASLLADGQFIVSWCRVLARNPYVNCGLLFRKIYEDYSPKLKQGKEQLLQYLQERGVLLPGQDQDKQD